MHQLSMIACFVLVVNYFNKFLICHGEFPGEVCCKTIINKKKFGRNHQIVRKVKNVITYEVEDENTFLQKDSSARNRYVMVFVFQKH